MLVILVTVPLKEAEIIQNTLVKEKLAACVNSFPVNSVYNWNGKVAKDEEILLIIKTKQSLYSKVEKRVKDLHSYEMPEIIALPIVKGSKSYLDWIKKETK